MVLTRNYILGYSKKLIGGVFGFKIYILPLFSDEMDSCGLCMFCDSVQVPLKCADSAWSAG